MRSAQAIPANVPATGSTTNGPRVPMPCAARPRQAARRVSCKSHGIHQRVTMTGPARPVTTTRTAVKAGTPPSSRKAHGDGAVTDLGASESARRAAGRTPRRRRWPKRSTSRFRQSMRQHRQRLRRTVANSCTGEGDATVWARAGNGITARGEVGAVEVPVARRMGGDQRIAIIRDDSGLRPDSCASQSARIQITTVSVSQSSGVVAR